MRFNIIHKFNRIFENLSSDELSSVHFFSTHSGKFEEVSLWSTKKSMILSAPAEKYKPALHQYLLGNGSIGVSRIKDASYQMEGDAIDAETFIADICRSFTESEILTILGGTHDFTLQQVENGKNIITTKFRNSYDIMVFSFFFRSNKSVSEYFRTMGNQNKASIYASILVLVLLGYLTIKEIMDSSIAKVPATANGYALINHSNGTATEYAKQPTNQIHALKRLVNKIRSI
jgi:hypothetical protein